MASKKKKQQVNRRSSGSSIAQDGNGNGNGNGNDEDSAPRKQVLDTPFSIDVFQVMSRHPYDDATLPQKLNTVVHIRPEAIWASLSKYNSFIIQNHKYAVHHYALVSRFQPLPKVHDPLDTDSGTCCPARILEIRAFDAKNVYIRLYWLYTPDQLRGGRQPHHGEDELIVTNHMEIVDAARVIEPITVVSLEENEKSWQISTHGVYYWRQTYHYLTRELSPPKTHCICNRPVCPDEVLVRCTNPQCALLLHGKCIEDATLNKLRLQLQQPDTPLIRPLSEINLRGPSSTGQNGAATDYATRIIISQRSHTQGRKRVGCTDVRADRHWERDIECLGCGTRIQ
ncbi:MAG: hypothetical protein L6R42_006446 [Xanthoria sp. 1 TBL-2021]|nr:MAG: hypothetical protein L6R42_006446 [Xanthoria sp. 1 TBL-2021]